MIHVRRAALVVVLLSVCAVAQAQIVDTPDITFDHLTSDQVSWMDSSGATRTVVLAHDAAGYKFDGVNTVYGGAIRSWTYPFGAGSRTATVTTYGNGGFAGFGYVVQHTGVYPCVVGADDSPLGWSFPITGFTRVFVGRHHAILRLTQNYQRNCPNTTRYTPVTIDWIFSTGRDNPVYAITFDPSAASSAGAPNILNDDARAPYGEFNVDGNGTSDIDGVAWGDRYKFTTTSAPVNLTTDWDYTAGNIVPFIKEWINDKGNGLGNATMGLVQTQTFLQQDAGGARDAAASPNNIDLRNLWTFTSANKNGCNAQKMPCGDDWAYQASGDSIQCNCGANNNLRITWKTMFGFVGASNYNSNNVIGGAGATPPGYPKKSYSVYVVIGAHTPADPVDAQVAQVENVQNATLTATVGSVVANGPSGVADVTSVNYAPAGYNHIYGALAFNANGSSQLDANIALSAGTLTRPLIIVGNYTSGQNPTVILNGTTLAADTQYFASLRTAANELWITLNSNLSGATNHLQINMTGLSAPTGVSATASGVSVTVNWNTVAGATAYEIDRSDNVVTHGWATLTTNWGAPPFNDIVSGNTAYAYRVRAKNAGGISANSLPDVATTVSYTNAITAGATVMAVDLAELRNAVNLVRALANYTAGAYTDGTPAGVTIKAVHITELRTQLDQALGFIGVPLSAYTDNPLTGVQVKAAHFVELRNRMQ